MEDLALWQCRLRCYLECQHPIYTPVQVPTVPLPMQLHASVHWKPGKDRPSTKAPATQVRSLTFLASGLTLPDQHPYVSP